MRSLFESIISVTCSISFSLFTLPVAADSNTGLALTSATKRLSGHVPTKEIANAEHIGRLNGSAELNLTISLGLRNQTALEELIKKQHDPKDPQYGQFLSPQQFAKQFGPSPDEMNKVKTYLAAHKMKIIGTTTNTIKVLAQVTDIEKSFNLELHKYKSAEKRDVYSSNMDPAIDPNVAAQITGVLGLNNFTQHRTHLRYKDKAGGKKSLQPFGSGPQGGLSPSDIKRAYNFIGSQLTGSGQTLALMELDGYTASDISIYTQTFGLSNAPTLQNISVDGFNGVPGQGADEVTLDIELMMAVAPGASKILVYEGPNSATGPLDVYTKIADDNLAKQISTSWGSPESQNTAAYINSENSIFMQMAAQGQSIYAAAGDSGAYDDGQNLSVDDPGSQPYVVSTGGTTLSVNSDGSYNNESSWGIPANGQAPLQGGGGGVSSIWPLPTWQTGLSTATNQGSATHRMVPDVSLEANPQTGYAIYTNGAWTIIGGTSCAAPLWAGFTALVNQARVAGGQPTLGFANLALYALGTASNANKLFHDVNDQSTNLFYPAVNGYDLSTGLGSLNATALLAALTTSSPSPLDAPVGLTATAQNQAVNLSWQPVTGAISYAVSRGASATGPFSQVAGGLADTQFSDSGLTNGTTYFYEVAAQGITSSGPESTPTSATPTLMPPPAPTNFTAAQAN